MDDGCETARNGRSVRDRSILNVISQKITVLTLAWDEITVETCASIVEDFPSLLRQWLTYVSTVSAASSEPHVPPVTPTNSRERGPDAETGSVKSGKPDLDEDVFPTATLSSK
ncbi:hypothetical protein KIN20_010205 [Parelaphostrongylus tenuis]|uniref:Uncharacterized protein n=1 Tax=Parelaphostrongylus tenuis TaxID=148309 RepID=A0AAD5MQ85_PARTN|nr:hypothetical protein KIN20_010205 [Parelaphostrongylus tenuis]